jgi:hypothetical protein
VLLDRIHAQPDQLGIALGELRFDPGHVAEFGGADGREILGVREQDGPAVADPFVKSIGPCVVSAVKSGAISLILNDMIFSSLIVTLGSML